ncbi:tyrosine/serine/threonine protein phosphatase [Didymosphaeria variabile]|uniref:protein-tyrosine-phosphatase n=1 Tax=Didymosphaeria variabile TaxID=1932322 RepID=A0A9W8XXS8_9PLEO|nr:tyrosine/serine/threonine protein phosphatase [Didymosphaeria variabile]KAJ4360700.1 tyrosine/serine/threonine protein phosphatase [Didymosphaeria variabile]
MDSSSVTDPSPGPSPESPVAKAATSFVADFRSRRTDNGSQESSPSTFFELQRPTTPAKKPRNLKNLGINTSTSLGNLRLNPSASLPAVEKQEKNSSAPPSPSFIKPPTPPRRRPSNLSLTISTPGSQENKPMRLIIPSTPSFNRPALRHFQSSPSLPLCSPAVGPSGGMQFPSLRPVKANPRALSEVPYEMEEEEEQEPNFDIPQSREEKPAAYPNGPIQIYPSGVFLYFEPTAAQACTFDVIFNVASEVKNPFTTPASESQKDLDARRLDGPPAENPDFTSILDETQASLEQETSSPTTPKATPVLDTIHPSEYLIDGKTQKTPEYIHMMWEHNTDIVSDLYRLVKTMDERVQQGKRVLVHCQCGVSRSASLIVAYGLYKNPGMSVQEAYDIAKKRSKWIGPNMNLIMQLQEFRNGLLKANESRSFNQGFGRRSAGLPTGVSVATNRHSPFDRNMPTGPRTPRTAPLPPDTDINLQRASTGNMMAISPGPLSAPSGSSLFSPGFRQSWAASQTQFDLSPKSSPTATPYVDPKGHIVPVLAITDNDSSAVEVSPSTTEEAQPQSSDHEAGLKPYPVPNFSRQLPFRLADGDTQLDRPRSSPNVSNLLAPSQGHDLPLRSPAVATFNIPSLAPDHALGVPLKSPAKPEFNLNPWPKGYDLDPYTRSDSPPPPPLSPRTFEFNAPQRDEPEPTESYDARYNRASDSTIRMPSLERSTKGNEETDSASPVRTEFPSDIFGRDTDVVKQELTSPRATEFHMTPLKPRVADEDPFGLASPRHFEFPPSIFKHHNFAQREAELEAEARRPSFQAILPPSNLAQPESVNGFASLNSTAQAPPAIQTPSFARPKSGELDARIDSVSPTENIPFSESPLPVLRTATREPPVTPKSPGHAYLSTPSKQNGIKSRFSSPNLREQRKLHKLQTEMEAMLPTRAPQPTQTVDDLDALMSPRAEEFTRNPFHFDLRSPTDEVSPASSIETVKDGQTPTEWTEKRQWTPQKSLDDDPRSPVQTGSSPIVRNIWDVL